MRRSMRHGLPAQVAGRRPTRRAVRRPSWRLVALTAAVLPLAAGCASTRVYEATTLPQPAPSASSPAPAASTIPNTCADRLRSYDPQPLSRIADSPIARRVKARGRLVVGVSSDTLLFGSRDPVNGKIMGFDIDLARAVAQALLGSPDKIELRVITTAQRLPLLTEKDPDKAVDMVARTMTINCDRWTKIAFSAEYYHARQGVLVARETGDERPITSVNDLTGKRVCAAGGSTSIDNLKAKVPGATVVPAATHTGCLILFQRSEVDAITGDDTVLAGLAWQDPYAKVLPERFSDEPYGLGLPKEDPIFAGLVNTALAEYVSSGGWAASYRTWLAKDLGPGTPPTPQYGRR